MTDGELDFRYGWRWLLPLHGCKTFSLSGFDTEAAKFLSASLMRHGLISSTKPDVLLISDISQKSRLESSDLECARLVCVIAERLHAHGWRASLEQAFPHLREYALLPANNPRVVVPLSSKENVLSGLCLHRPGRRAAQLGLFLARMLARIGNYSLLRGRMLLMASHDPGAMAKSLKSVWVGPVTSQDLDYALYLGTPDENRKTIVLPLNASEPKTIIKVAGSPKARAAVSNEVAALIAMSQSGLANCVPRFHTLVEEEESLALFQEYRQREWVSRRKMEDAVVGFLGELSTVNRHTRLFASILSELNGSLGKEKSDVFASAYESLWSRLQLHAESGEALLVHRSHGDFAPWNCAWTGQGIFVYDWEASQEVDLAFSDAFYYATAPAQYVQSKPDAKKTLDKALRLASQVGGVAGFHAVNVKAYLAIWLMARASKAPLYGEMLQILAREWQ